MNGTAPPVADSTYAHDAWVGRRGAIHTYRTKLLSVMVYPADPHHPLEFDEAVRWMGGMEKNRPD